jgi:4-hydroxybenzoate polyprenyltransferase
MFLSALDALAFSSLLVSSSAAALVAAASLAMGVPLSWTVIGLVFGGTLAVYNVDRLRDVERDRATAPVRTRFIAAHRTTIIVVTAAAMLLAVSLAFIDGRRAAMLAGVVLALGLAHRRLKGIAFAKPLYVTAAWLAIVVGMPLVVEPASRHGAWVAAILGASLLANAIASDVRDGEAGTLRLGARRALRLAVVIAALGALVATFAPSPARPLGTVAAATLLALIGFRRTERYGMVVIDGALLAGAATSLLLTALP